MSDNRRPRRVALVSLGCAKNTVDSESALGQLLSYGMELTNNPAKADLLIVNTCGFIDSARAESRGQIEEALRHKKKNRKLKVVAMGCLAQRSGEELAKQYPALDGVLGLSSYKEFLRNCLAVLDGKRLSSCAGAPERLESNPRLVVTGVYANLRLSDGCDNRCTYCAIPLIRGSLKSLPMAEILDEAERLEESGARELCLVAQDITAYGLDAGGKYALAGLLEKLLKRTSGWIRLMYAHPAHLQDDVIALLASEPRLLGYLDLPIQHINDRILTAMNRHVDRATIEAKLGKLREQVKDLTLRTSLICGFPGETEDEFEELLAFIAAGNFNYAGAFAYSREADTPAFDLAGQVEPQKILDRVGAVMEAQQDVTFRWLDRRVGQVEEAIVTACGDNGVFHARTRHEAPDVDGLLIGRGEVEAGDIISAKIYARDGYDLLAEALPGKG